MIWACSQALGNVTVWTLEKGVPLKVQLWEDTNKPSSRPGAQTSLQKVTFFFDNRNSWGTALLRMNELLFWGWMSCIVIFTNGALLARPVCSVLVSSQLPETRKGFDNSQGKGSGGPRSDWEGEKQKRLCDSRHFKSKTPLTDDAVWMSEVPDRAFGKHFTFSSWALELYPSELLVSLAILLEHLYWLSVETSFSKIITLCTARRGHFPLCHHTCHQEPSAFCLSFSTDKQWPSSDNWSHYSGGTAVFRMLLFTYPVSIYQTLRKLKLLGGWQ